MLLSAPFTRQIHDAEVWKTWVTELGGGRVTLIWVRSDAPSLRHRLEQRGSERDAAKLADFDSFLASMHLDQEPAADHLTIDNRLTTSTPINHQLQTALHSLPPRHPPPHQLKASTPTEGPDTN